MSPKSTKRRAVSVPRVHGALRELATRFELRPGEHVNEMALARRLGVSRTPVREALNRLVSEGLIDFVPNKGFYARPLDIDAIRHRFELRHGLEEYGVRLACRRASDADIAALREWWRAVKAGRDVLPLARVAALDEEFHERLMALAGNPEMARALRDCNARLAFVRAVAMENPRYRRITFVEHLEILAALARREEARAAELMARHIGITLDDVEHIAKESIARIFMRGGGAGG
jgi:DNA-binding GntR family transcriptional regulator